MKSYSISVIPGDGIGREVIPEALKVLDLISSKFDFGFKCKQYEYSCDYYAKNGQMMPDDGLDRLRDSDGIFLGAVGCPEVPDHISLWGLLIPIRRTFQQYVNLRPVRFLEGITSPLKNPEQIDYYIVRENNEGEYSAVGGKVYEGTDQEVAIQQSIFSRKGVDRVMKYAFELASARNMKVASATKSNGIVHSMPFWDERFKAMAQAYPEVETNQFHIDILAAHLVLNPQWFDVIVASNLFGDILSDLGPAVVGGMGIAAGANINPEKEFPSMFEPVHGSAPDIAGKGIANPIASFWTAQMMLAHLGEVEAAESLMEAIVINIRRGEVLTRDLGGKASTQDVTNDILKILKEI